MNSVGFADSRLAKTSYLKESVVIGFLSGSRHALHWRDSHDIFQLNHVFWTVFHGAVIVP